VLWCGVLQCGGLASREFVCDLTARGHGSLVGVCVGVMKGTSYLRLGVPSDFFLYVSSPTPCIGRCKR
jgi:hypothetical protein